MPKVLETLNPLPTQLYVTVAGPTKEIFNDVLHPAIGNAWENFNKTLDLLPSLDTRTVIRHTMVKNVNFPFYDQYEKMDRRADPDFIESKGYVHVGQSAGLHMKICLHMKRLWNFHLPWQKGSVILNTQTGLKAVLP
jgi:tRNA wybutosine-synthesizing protein 1